MNMETHTHTHTHAYKHTYTCGLNSCTRKTANTRARSMAHESPQTIASGDSNLSIKQDSDVALTAAPTPSNSNAMELNSVGAADGGGGDGGRAGGDSSSSRSCTDQPASAATGTFGSQHLAEVLNAAFYKQKDMQGLVTKVKDIRRKAFTGVTKTKRINGKNIFLSSMQMAESIAECRPDRVSTAEELLSWIVVSSTEFNVLGVVSRLL